MEENTEAYNLLYAILMLEGSNNFDDFSDNVNMQEAVKLILAYKES